MSTPSTQISPQVPVSVRLPLNLLMLLPSLHIAGQLQIFHRVHKLDIAGDKDLGAGIRLGQGGFIHLGGVGALALQIGLLGLHIDGGGIVKGSVQNIALQLPVIGQDRGHKRLLVVVVVDDLSHIGGLKGFPDVILVQVNALDDLDLREVLAMLRGEGGQAVHAAPDLVLLPVKDDDQLPVVDALIRILRYFGGGDVGQLKVGAAPGQGQPRQHTSDAAAILRRAEGRGAEGTGDFVRGQVDDALVVALAVAIGTQSWMADNLAYLPEVNDPSAEQDGCTGNPLYFVLNYQGSDLAAAKATKEYKNYGVLYNWWAAMGKQNATGGDANAVPSGVQGVCPNGWHLPSRAEWKVLEEYVASQLPNVDGNGMYSDYGTALEHDCRNVWGALASQIGWGATSMGEEGPELLKGGQDTYGMHIIPSGNVSHIADYYGNWFKETDKAVDFWLTDLIDNGGDDYNNYWAATINWSVDNKDYRPKYSTYGTRAKMGLSVRCVKD